MANTWTSENVIVLHMIVNDHTFIIFTSFNHHLLLSSFQIHVPFMKYVSVGCVVGIIAGFCIGPGELFCVSLPFL